MMRTGPQPRRWKLGPSLCAGLTLAHYDCFKSCRSLAALKKRFKREMPFEVEHGIHVLLSQTALGELTIGDSHHYGSTHEPFNREDIDAAILRYLRSFAKAPSFEIAERWNGIYPKVPGRTEFIANPAPGVTVVNGLGGAGMTLSFGLAEEVIRGSYRP
jgi:glycine/D-amino acid oxidase-like deaminating enzyme